MQGCWAPLGCDLREGKKEEARERAPHAHGFGGQEALSSTLLSPPTLSLPVQTLEFLISCHSDYENKTFSLTKIWETPRC